MIEIGTQHFGPRRFIRETRERLMGPRFEHFEAVPRDVSWRRIPWLGSVLRAREVPPVGGDTMWCDMEAVYTGLPEPLREEIEGRYAIHDFVHTFGHMLSPEEKEQRHEEFPPAAHPIVRSHPVSGRRCRYVNPVFTSHVDGLPEAESDALLSELYSHARVPEYQVRFRWKADSIAFWDDRSTQRYAISDYWPLPRVMDRITIIGDEPR